MTFFIDTGILFALYNRRDRKHNTARRIVDSESGDPITTDHVVVECWSLLQRKSGHHDAMRFWSALRSTPLIVEFVDAADLERAAAIAERWRDQAFSLVDCTSFAVMERIGCSRAASFDADFAVYRYGPDGKRAFEILRS